MRTIWKQPIDIRTGEFTIEALALRVVHVGLDPARVPCIWYEHAERSGPGSLYDFWVVGTGHPTPERGAHVGSFVDGPFVWHIYGGYAQ